MGKGIPIMEFHISRRARDRYQFDLSLFSISGDVIFADIHSVRLFAQKMNKKRDLISFPEETIHAGELYAMGLIDEILHYVFGLYQKAIDPAILKRAINTLYQRLGQDSVDKALRIFIDEFPPLSVYKGEISAEGYMDGETEGIPNRQIILEEMVMLWLENANPAFSPFLELFDDLVLEKDTCYMQIISELHTFFDREPFFGPDNQNIMDMLHSPAVVEPHSLTGQLKYIMERWRDLLARYLYLLLKALDLIREEELLRTFGPGRALVYEYAGLEKEYERYSPDRDWMPKVVLLAKNVYVWLDQLSKRYKRPITRLDQIPDEELDTLSRWGFTGLWLIGLWERSPASQKIKQLCGNVEAVASAYSLFDYEIAKDLGGEEAFKDLQKRAWIRGIRMASDMVPNHTGIYSRWVIEHPDWFISLNHSPYPSYDFSGPDLSSDERVGIFIENKYYTRTDAAVVFKRVDRWTGSELYIYHGNDGTHMPWNDTAQLNYLKPEVREAVIQTILHVARNFPIIRFDAAMTLTKKHYQRLWFPEPGTGGAIPSRAEYGMSKKEFDSHMPEEFWREVVDRVAREVPDTLLLAEAFWLMEGYFVRTLGMHRVYNSAFMNMLKNEDNASYRSVIKNTLEFDPEILKRFVNFMNNPDEETAIAQFGRDDKYFGVCTMMVTMPGLPMFGHGQIEGFHERYGMEYRRAYWDEEIDTHLVERHEREIFPLMKMRHIFADVKNFLLYDFFTPEGYVNEDVFAYSNRHGDERALIVYHNRFAEARGWIKESVAFSVKSDGDKRLVKKSLAEGLGLTNDERFFCIFKDHKSGLEYIRNSKELFEKGLYVELGAYKCHVFLNFREVMDNEWHQYAHLAGYLNGRGVPGIEEALKEIFLKPIHDPFKGLVNTDVFSKLTAICQKEKRDTTDREFLQGFKDRISTFIRGIADFTGGKGDLDQIVEDIYSKLEVIIEISNIEDRLPLLRNKGYKGVLSYIREEAGLKDPVSYGVLFGWLFLHSIGMVSGREGFEEQSRSWIKEWLLDRILAGVFRELGCDEGSACWKVLMVEVITTHQRWYEIKAEEGREAYKIILSWLKDEDIQHLIQVNRYQEILWFNKESFEELLWWMFLVSFIKISASEKKTHEEKAEDILKAYNLIERIKEAGEESGYQIERLLSQVKGRD